MTGTHLSLWPGPTYHRDRDPLTVVTGTHLSLWPGPTYHCDRDPLTRDSFKTTATNRLTLGFEDEAIRGGIMPPILSL